MMSVCKIPRIIIAAAHSGSGKTTIYKSVFFDKDYVGKRINTDEMVARLGSWKDNDLQMKAAREAVKMINYYLKNDISFHQETTLAGKSILVNINKAKKNGFYVVMNYIGLENYDIAKEINGGKQMRSVWEIATTPKSEKLNGKKIYSVFRKS